jgi:hypothetical protein
LQFSLLPLVGFRRANPDQEQLLQGDAMIPLTNLSADFKFWVDSGLKFTALVFGAGWTVHHYLRGRTYARKPVLTVGGRLFRKNGQHYLSILCRVKNVGQSKYVFKHKGLACLVWVFTRSAPNIPWLVYPSRVFQLHKWVEPGAQIEDTLLVPIPSHVPELQEKGTPKPLIRGKPISLDESNVIAFRLGLRVVSRRGGTEWNTCSMIAVPETDQILSVEKSSTATSTDGGLNVDSEARKSTLAISAATATNGGRESDKN